MQGLVEMALALNYPHVIASFLASLFITYITCPLIMKLSLSMGWTRPDLHKPGNPQVPTLGGLALLVGLASGGIAACLLEPEITVKVSCFLMVAFTTFMIGLFDDFKGIGARMKTLMTVLGSVPIFIFAALFPHDITLGRPIAPLIGRMRLTLAYWLLLPFAIAVPSNAVNMLESLNGVMPIMCGIGLIAVFVSSVILGNTDGLIFSSLLLGTLAAYYHYNKYPSRLFSGNCGSFSIGASLGALAILSNLEFVIMMILMPHIMNAFYIISSVGGLKEKSKIIRPVVIKGEVLEASIDERAPLTLIRLILARRPMREIEVIYVLALTELVASTFAIISSILIKLSM